MEDQEVKQEDLNPLYVMRVSSCVLCIQHGTGDEFYEKLMEALAKDSRVKDLVRPHPARVKINHTVFPAAGLPDVQMDIADRVNPDIHFHCPEIAPPIRFQIQVPRRLQPQPLGEREVPTDEYWVEWNGITLATLWRHEGSDDPYGYSGGLSAINIVSEAAESADLDTHVLPCGPNCDYPYTHTDLVLIGGDSDGFSIIPTDHGVAFIELPSLDISPDRALSYVMREVSFLAKCYAAVRFESAAMAATESAARRHLTELLTLLSTQASSRPRLKLSYLRARWANRRWRSKGQHIITRLWLAMVAIEARRQQWNNLDFIYKSSAGEKGLEAVFRPEYSESENIVKNLDVEAVVSATEHASAHLGTKSMAFVTMVAALTSAVIAAIVTLLK
ncbi:hypothetical protein [Microbispora hainanensis]|uniref:hypothetical protein n=1 Tax=Microbispora hainanensis TaxID=568844 RepID=UPI0033D88FC0